MAGRILLTEQDITPSNQGRVLLDESDFGSKGRVLLDESDVTQQPTAPKPTKPYSPASAREKQAEMLVGAGEAALEFGTNVAAMPAKGWAGLAGLPFGKSEEWAEKVPTYKAKTETGGAMSEALAKPFELYHDKVTPWVTEKLIPDEQNVGMRTATKTMLDIFPYSRGKMGSGKPKAPTTVESGLSLAEKPIKDVGGSKLTQEMTGLLDESLHKPLKKVPKKFSKAEQRLYDIGGDIPPRQVKGGTVGDRVIAVEPKIPGKKLIFEDEMIQSMNERVVGNAARETGGMIDNPIRMFEKLGKEAKEKIYNPIDDAAYEVVREHHFKYKPMIEDMQKVIDGKKLGDYRIAQQEGGKAILKKMKVKPPKKLSQTEMFADKIMTEAFADLFDQIQSSRIKSGKKPIGKVENYHTFFRQLDWMTKNGENPLAGINVDKALYSDYMHPSSVFFKHGIARKKSNIPVERDAFKSFDRYVATALDSIKLSPEIAKARELIKPYKESHPEAFVGVTEYLDFVSGKSVGSAKFPKVSKALNKLSKNIGGAILSWNVRSGVIQPTALVNTWTVAKTRHTLTGFYRALDPTKRQDVYTKGNLLGRKFDVTAEAFMSDKGLKANIVQKGMKFLQLLDMKTAIVSWHAFYDQAIKSFKYSEKEAVRYANDQIVKTQASAMKQHISPIQRRSLGKAATALQTFVINDWGFLTQDILGIGKNVPKTKANIGMVVRYVVGASLLNHFFEDVLHIHSPYGRPVHEGLKEYNETGSIPSAIATSAVEATERLPVVGSYRYGAGLGGAVMDTALDWVKGVDAKDPLQIAEATAKLKGIPATGQIMKMVRRLNEPLYNMIMGTKREE